MTTNLEPGDVFVFDNNTQSGVVIDVGVALTVSGGGRTPIAVSRRSIPHGARQVSSINELPGRIDHYHVLLGAAGAALVLINIQVEE